MYKIIAFAVSIALLSGCAQSTGYENSSFPVLAHPVTDTEKPNLCLIGDSRTAMFPVELFTKFDVYDYGVGGSTTEDNVEILSALAESGIRFDAIIVSVGVNDYMGGNTITESVCCLNDCVALAKTLSDRVFITTIPGCTPNSGKAWDKVVAISENAQLINSHIPTIAKVNNVTVLPLSESLAWCYNYVWSIYDDGSGIHWNAEGYKVVYNLYMSYLVKE